MRIRALFIFAAAALAVPDSAAWAVGSLDPAVVHKQLAKEQAGPFRVRVRSLNFARSKWMGKGFDAGVNMTHTRLGIGHHAFTLEGGRAKSFLEQSIAEWRSAGGTVHGDKGLLIFE